jgi:hypothetical protein
LFVRLSAVCPRNRSLRPWASKRGRFVGAGMLNGICPEAVELLNSSPCPFAVFNILRQMVPLRPIEAAELMICQSNYTAILARALLVATHENQLVPSSKSRPKEQAWLADQIARMERELVALQSQRKSVEEQVVLNNWGRPSRRLSSDRDLI